MDFRLINTTDGLELGTTLERYERNMQAIRIAKSDSAPSPEELGLLARYVGWGDSQVYKEFNSREHPVKADLSLAERRAIDASIINAHYTDVPVIATMWKLLEHLGFGKRNDLTILDPSAGASGLFKSAAPDWAFMSKWMEIELDIVSGKILKKLHPASDVRIQGFQDLHLPDDYQFDLAVTNVPFADVGIHWKNIYGSIHNFFLMKTASMLREGGVMAMLTSRYSLDSSNNEHLYFLRKHGMKMLGAFRLPDNAFKKNARTEVVTDFLFLIKDQENRLPGLDQHQDEWLEQVYKYPDMNTRGGYGYYLTKYYDNRRDQILGIQSLTGTMYGKNSYTVIPSNEFNTIDRFLEVGLRILPKAIYRETETVENDESAIAPSVRIIETDGLFGKLPASNEKLERIKRLTEIYKLAKDLIAADYADAHIDNAAARIKLNSVYDTFVLENGHINEQRSLELVKGTPAGMFLQALEIVISGKDKVTQYKKAAIFFKRTINSFPVLKAGASIKDAFTFVVGSTGEVSIPRIEKLTGKSVDEIIAALQDEMFWDPKDREWVPGPKYLSGDVRGKLEYATNIQKMSKYDISRNITELEAVLPPWKKYTDFVTSMQARWIPNEIIKDFLADLFGISDTNLEVEYIEALDERKIQWPTYIPYTDLCQTFGTYDMDAKEIIVRILNSRPIIVYGKTINGDTYKDEQATLAAQEKARIIREKFDKWIYDNSRRIQVLEDIFNRRFNNHVNQKFDGSNMIFDGLNTDITLHPYQADGAARIVFSQNTLLSYDVGWGKTFTFLLGIMKSISCGLAKKAMLVVPNHLVEQTVKQVMWAYPLANILFPTPDDTKKNTRPIFCSRIATGNYDLVVVPFSFFKLMPIDNAIIRETIQDKIDELEEIIKEKFGNRNLDKMDTATRKRLEKAKMRLEEKLKKMSEMKKDSSDTITFDKLGVDMLVVDEFHAFKNVEILTRMQSVAGLSTQGNQSTFDMVSKIAWMQKRGNKIVGSTATPITNTIGEAYSLMKYFCPDILAEKGLSHFDAWADMFAVIEAAPEMTPDGSGFRMNNRFRKFVNVEQLSTMISMFAEMRRGNNEATFARPDVYGTQMTKIVLPSTDELREYVKELAHRAEIIKSGGVRPDEDNMLLITSDGRKAALDISLVKPKKNLALANMPKIAALVNNVFNIWLESAPTKSTQLVFCDIGIWKPTKENEKEQETETNEILTESESKVTRDVYSIIRNALVAKGIPEQEVVFAHEAVNPQQRREREDDMNSGKVRILIGSTAKMGTGMNVQTRMIAIHHLDAPWRPADIEQRNGRGWRQGNYHKKIMLFVYVIQGSFDGYVWQTLETKMSFCDQFMRGHLHSNEMDDISETVLSFAEIKAEASGNHRVIEFVVLGNEIRRLAALKAAFDKNKLIARARWKSKVVSVEDVEKHSARLKTIMAIRDKTPADPFEIEIDRRGEYVKIDNKAEAGKTLRAAIADQIGAVLNGRKEYALLGFYRGLEIRLYSSISNKGGTRYTLSHLDMDFDFNVSESDEGTIQSLINVTRSFEKGIKLDDEKIEQIRSDDLKTQEEIEKPWEFQAHFDEICTKYDALANELSSSNSNPLDELEKRKEAEKILVEKSQFVLDEIRDYIIECHRMPSYLSLFTTLDGSGIVDALAHQEEQPLTDLVREKIKQVQKAVQVLEHEYVAIFQQVVIKSKNKKSGLGHETVQFAFF